MTETEQFLAEMTDQVRQAETAIHDGDAGPRIAMWSRTEPLTVFGAAASVTGWSDVEQLFHSLERQFSDCTSYENRIVAAEARGDLAYIVALEHTSASIHGEPRTYVLRATTIFRREAGGWKVVHRHGDALADVPGTLGIDARV